MAATLAMEWRNKSMNQFAWLRRPADKVISLMTPIFFHCWWYWSPLAVIVTTDYFSPTHTHTHTHSAMRCENLTTSLTVFKTDLLTNTLQSIITQKVSTTTTTVSSTLALTYAILTFHFNCPVGSRHFLSRLVLFFPPTGGNCAILTRF